MPRGVNTFVLTICTVTWENFWYTWSPAKHGFCCQLYIVWLLGLQLLCALDFSMIFFSPNSSMSNCSPNSKKNVEMRAKPVLQVKIRHSYVLHVHQNCSCWYEGILFHPSSLYQIFLWWSVFLLSQPQGCRKVQTSREHRLGGRKFPAKVRDFGRKWHTLFSFTKQL